MRRTKTLALWATLCCGSLSGRAEVDSFTICSPAAVGRIEVRYFLAGAFGGYGGFVHDSDEDRAYRIPLEQDGRMGQTSKRSYTRRGASSPFFSVDLLSDSNTNRDVRLSATLLDHLRRKDLGGSVVHPGSGCGGPLFFIMGSYTLRL